MTFATSLRTFRERQSPRGAGIAASLPAARRTPGLRRGELAGLAGISAEHLRRLEQGRRRPSLAVVDSLARALGLSAGEHGQLRALAGFAAAPLAPGTGPPDSDHLSRPGSGLVPRDITPAARRMLERMAGVPVCVCDASWTVLDGNRCWHATRCPVGAAPGHGRNIAWRMFTGAPSEVSRTAAHAGCFRAAILTDLRAAARRYPADPQLHALIADLRARSGEFARLWDVAPVTAHGHDRLSVPARDMVASCWTRTC